MSISCVSNAGIGNIMKTLSSYGPSSRTSINLARSTHQTQDITVDQLISKTSGASSQKLQDPSIEALKMDDILVSRHFAQGGSPALRLTSPMGPVTVDMTQLFR